MKKNIKENNKKTQSVIKYKNEDTNEIKKLLLILLGIIAVAALLFFITSKYLLKDGFQSEVTPTKEIEINYSKVDVGTMFNRPYEEYYVFAFDSKDTNSSYYNSLIGAYKGKVKIYVLDLSVPKNSAYLKEKANTNAKNVSELAFEKTNLIYIKSGKIADYLTDMKDIEKELK